MQQVSSSLAKVTSCYCGAVACRPTLADSWRPPGGQHLQLGKTKEKLVHFNCISSMKKGVLFEMCVP